jgi:hypothetical protein
MDLSWEEFKPFKQFKPFNPLFPPRARGMRAAPKDDLNEAKRLNDLNALNFQFLSHTCMFQVFMFCPPVSARGVTPVKPFLIASHSIR